MGEPFRLTVLTPEQTLLDIHRVAWVQAQLADGGPIGVYPGHAPLLAETVAAPLRYQDPSGERTFDLNAGILQVSGEGVTVFASTQASETQETWEVSRNDERFDRLARELLGALGAQADRLPGTEPDAS
jgi:F-type H+-transporting ATPase subunit epsilon